MKHEEKKGTKLSERILAGVLAGIMILGVVFGLLVYLL